MLDIENQYKQNWTHVAAAEACREGASTREHTFKFERSSFS